jgi:formate hydrogenlyase subunit 3/multisubunit Na+/H+ antiporter MnhD subunit
MQTGLLHLHNGLRWVILIALVLTILFLFTKNGKAKLTSTITLICSHIMLLVGIYQWFWGRYGFTKIESTVNIMKEKFYRFFLVEHPLMMLIAIVLITLGHKSVKINNSKKATILYIIALLLILAAVPWPFRGDGIGRGLYPSAQ